MIKMLYFPVIAIMLLFGFILSLMISSTDEYVPLLYVSDFNTRDDFYTVLDVETGDTLSFHRSADFKGIHYNGEISPPEREDYTSPYDDAVQFVLLRDYNNARDTEQNEQLYRVRDNRQLEYIFSSMSIYISWGDDGRYAYLFGDSEYGSQYDLHTLYRYDIQSAELEIVIQNVINIRLICQENWCHLISELPNGEDEGQILYVLNKNSGELRQVEEADDFNRSFWWRQNKLLYTPVHENRHGIIHVYDTETDQHYSLAEIEDKQIANIYNEQWTNSVDNNQSKDWLMVVSNSAEDDSIFDIYIVNNLADTANVYPLGIHTNNSSWVSYRSVPDGSLLLTTSTPSTHVTSNIYIINDITGHPTVEQLIYTDFDTEALDNVRLEYKLGDTLLLSMAVNYEEWAYFTIHIPTRTVTKLAMFSRNQYIIQTQLSADKNWLVVSIEEADTKKYYVVVVPTDGSQSVHQWDVGTESYVCLLAWYVPDKAPSACTLHFGMG